MTPERFAALADAYGGDLDGWPAAEYQAARAYLRGGPEAPAVLAAAAELDSALAAWTVPGPGSALAARIAATTASRHVRGRRLRLWVSGLAAAAALAGGVAAGAGFVATTAPSADQATAGLYGLSVLGASLDLGESPAPRGRL